MISSLKNIVFATATFCLGPLVWAQADSSPASSTAPLAVEPAPVRERPPLWEVGMVGLGVSQLAYPGSSEHVNRALVLPFLIYRGEYFHAEQNSAGLRAIKSKDYELDIGVSGAVGSNSQDNEARRGMPDLGTMIEFGPRLKWFIANGVGGGRIRVDFGLRGVFDISNNFALKGTTFEPELAFERASKTGWRYKAGVGAVFGDSQMADTLYGVAPAYATATRQAYEAKGGLITWRLSGSISRRLTPDLSFLAVTHVDSVDGAANVSSPLVRSNAGASFGLGLVYTFQRSRESAAE